VTVLFADLVGYTTFSDGRDPEEVRDFQARYYEQSRRVIQLFGGIVEKFIGDAVMAVWGAEIGNEDDAERAVRAGFELVDVVAKLSADVGAPDLSLRVGIHTGEAAVGPSDDHMGFVTGDRVNTAARLESVAEPGTVLVGEGTHQAAIQSVAFEPVGPQLLKGKSLPVPAWRATRVVSERGGRGRAESLEPPFVGRGQELRLLKDLLDTVGKESRTRLVSLVGEAGIGKSRLVWEFLKYIDGLVGDVYWHEGRSPSYGDGVTFWAIAEMIKARAGIRDGDSTETVFAQLDDALVTYVADPSDRDWMRPRLAAVLGEGEAPGDRSELDAAIRAFFEAISEQGTTVLVFEDLHWADTEMIDFVEALTDWWRGRPILVITMARPDLLEKRPSWGAGRPGVISVNLGPLGDAEMTDLVKGAVPGLPDHVASAIVLRAAGIPLYAVELLRNLLAQGELAGEAGDYRVVGDLSQMVVPESLQAVIGARLDRLDADERALIQDAAVLGQMFNVAGLAALTGKANAQLEGVLQSLTRRELIEPVRDPRSPGLGQYRFLQGLIRDVALGRLSRESRRSRHLAVAEHLEGHEDPELAAIVADHYLQALEASTPGDQRELIRSRALSSMAQAASRAADLKSHQQVMAISETALGIADSDEERAPFWEMMIFASSRLADTGNAERYATLAMDHHRRNEDVAALTRTTRALALAMTENNQSDRAVELLRPLLDSQEDLETDLELARAAALYPRALLLSWSPDVLTAVDRALSAVEKLGLVPETIDALITKGTALGQVGRLTEARIILEGAIALADHHRLGGALTRAQNNLAYILVGIDPEASFNLGEEAFRTAQRLGDRSVLLFSSGQMALNLATKGDFAGAEELLANPIIADPPPPIRVWIAALELLMAMWRGDLEKVDLLYAEIGQLEPQVDDPQVRASAEDVDLHVAVAHGRLEDAFSRIVELFDRPWNEVAEITSLALFITGLLGDPARCKVMAGLFEKFHPRYSDELAFARSLAEGGDGPIDPGELDSLIAKREQIGVVTDVVLFSAAAARFVAPPKRDDYLSQARALCQSHGWPGIHGLIDRYLG